MTQIATAPARIESVLTIDMLERFRERAPIYDRENRFFYEDFEELRQSGYLNIGVPEEFGGLGLRIDEVARAQRRLASYAPATAIAVNMHIYWTVLANDMRIMGDPSLEWLLREAGQGEIFAAGHAETGVDLPGYFSTTQAERVEGGYRFTGHKMFSSMTPVWTRLGVWGMDSSDPAAPMMVHGTINRDSNDYRVVETWDTLAMRATASHDTILEGAFCPDERVMRVLPAGTDDLFILCLNVASQLTFGSVYLGIADRALEIAIDTAHKRSSIALTRSMAYHPEVQHLLAEAVLAHEAAGAYVERVADDWVKGIDYGHHWALKLVGAKHTGVTAAQKVVDTAMTVSGGSGMFKRSELERLYRDVRAGTFHPANPLLVHEVVGKTALGVEDTGARWG